MLQSRPASTEASFVDGIGCALLAAFPVGPVRPVFLLADHSVRFSQGMSLYHFGVAFIGSST